MRDPSSIRPSLASLETADICALQRHFTSAYASFESLRARVCFSKFRKALPSLGSEP